MKFSRKFTLVELMLAMSIFAVLMLILMQIFGSTQDVWRKTGAKADSYESARIALNIIADDLASAIYVEDAKGKSFHYCNGNETINDGDKNVQYSKTLWFITKKPYTVDSGQRSLDVEVEYRLRAYTDDERDEDNIPQGLPLYKLEYYITTDAVSTLPDLNEYDFKTNREAHTTTGKYPLGGSKYKPRGILLENIIDFSVTPLYITVDGGSSINSKKCGYYLPNMVMISVKIIDNDTSVQNRYKSASAADKDLISRTFVRIIPIKRGQFYSQTDSKIDKIPNTR